MVLGKIKKRNVGRFIETTNKENNFGNHEVTDQNALKLIPWVKLRG
jgi:hypothetical protein